MPRSSIDAAALQERYLVFVDKLLARGNELVNQTIPQLQQLASSPVGVHDPVPGRVLSAVKTELRGLFWKAEAVFSEQLDCLDRQDRAWVNLHTVARDSLDYFNDIIERWVARLERAT
ncbi:MAG: hypothetical protein LBE83_09575, partial [Propionibacteriaceae bacterium]|nr:hypothetical protein [Propionibacteriaceae bacterium]